jgi:hypothetical protein
MKTQQLHTIDDFQKDIDWVSFDEDAISPENDENMKD